MKKFIFLVAVIVFAVWWFQKNGQNIIPPFPSFSSSSTPFSTSTLNSALGNIGDKIFDVGNLKGLLAGFETVTTSPMQENFSTHVGSVRFPQSYFIRSVREAIIDGGIGETLCSTTLKTSETLSTPEPKTIGGITVNRSVWSNAGAGNLYSGVVYSLKKGETCYGVTLFMHTTTPENYAINVAEAKQFRQEHDAAVKKIMDTFENMISSFRLKP